MTPQVLLWLRKDTVLVAWFIFRATPSIVIHARGQAPQALDPHAYGTYRNSIASTSTPQQSLTLVQRFETTLKVKKKHVMKVDNDEKTGTYR